MSEEDEFWQALRRGDNEAVLAVFKDQKNGAAKLKLANSVGKRGLSPSHWACFNDNVELLKMLKHYDADVNAPTKKVIENWRTLPYLAKGTTPMHACCHSNSPGCAALLLEWEIDINAQTSEGHTAAFVAASHGHSDVLKLIAESPLVKPQFELGNTAACDVSGWAKGATPLMAAAAGRTGLNCVEILLSQFVNPNACDENGWTAVHYAAKNGCAGVIAKLATEAKADVNVQTTVGTRANRRNATETQRGFTPLHLCVKFCQYPRDDYRLCLRELLKAGVDPNAVDDRGWSAAMWACSRDDADMLSALTTGCTELTNEELDITVASSQNVTITVQTIKGPNPAQASISPTSMKRSDSLNGTPLSGSPIPGSPTKGSRHHSRHGSLTGASPLGLSGAGSYVGTGSPSLSVSRGLTGVGGEQPKVLVFPVGSTAYSISKAKQALACLETLIREKIRRRNTVLPTVGGDEKQNGTPILSSPSSNKSGGHDNNSIQGSSGGLIRSMSGGSGDDDDDQYPNGASQEVGGGDLMLDPVEQYIESKIKLESERDEIKAKIDKMEMEVSVKKDEISTLKSKPKEKDKDKKLERAQSELDAARAEIGRLRKQIKDFENLKTDMEEQLRDARNALAAKEEMWKKEMMAAHEQIALLDAKVRSTGDQQSLQSLQATKAEVERQQNNRAVLSSPSSDRKQRSPPTDKTVLSDAADGGNRKAAAAAAAAGSGSSTGRRINNGPAGAFERAASSSTSQSLFDYMNDEKNGGAVNSTPAKPSRRNVTAGGGGTTITTPDSNSRTPLLKDKNSKKTKRKSSDKPTKDRNMVTYASDAEEDDDDNNRDNKKSGGGDGKTDGGKSSEAPVEGSKCCCVVM